MQDYTNMSIEQLIQEEKGLRELVLCNPNGPYEYMRQDMVFNIRKLLNDNGYYFNYRTSNWEYL